MTDIAFAIWFGCGLLTLALCGWGFAMRLAEFDDDTLGGLTVLFIIGPIGLCVVAGTLWAQLAVARERSDTGRRDRSNGQVPGTKTPSSREPQ